jgi:hypothetical protein
VTTREHTQDCAAKQAALNEIVATFHESGGGLDHLSNKAYDLHWRHCQHCLAAREAARLARAALSQASASCGCRR